MPIFCPRSRRSSSRPARHRSFPSNHACPSIRNWRSRSPRIAFTVMLFPLPDSPRIPRHCPGSTSKLTFSTNFFCLFLIFSSTFSPPAESAAPAHDSGSFLHLLRIQHIPQGISHQVKRCYQNYHRNSRNQHLYRIAGEDILRLAQHRSPFRCRCLYTQSQK